MTDPVFLSRLTLNLRSAEARRDLGDCMAMHRTLMKAFPDGLSSGEARSDTGVLYRVEPTAGAMRLLVQSRLRPNWGCLPDNWQHPGAPPESREITEALGRVGGGSVLRFRLVANPTRKIDTKTGPDGRKNNGRRVELRGEDEWLAWLERKAEQCGFRLKAVRAAAHVPDVRSSRDVRATGVKRAADGASSRVTFRGVIFEGRLKVVDANRFLDSLRAGIGPGKAYGYGLLSIARGD
jgi:CRISPR system Cascade subunit CasE